MNASLSIEMESVCSLLLGTFSMQRHIRELCMPIMHGAASHELTRIPE